MSIVTLDFETHRIEPRPKFPPEPVGLAVRYPDGRKEYIAWGHPVENNATREDAEDVLRMLWADPGTQLLFHNASFDLSVCYERLGLPVLPWHRVHDTLYLLFLHEPHAPNLSLKPASERLLGWAPEEQDAVNDWIWEHRKELQAQTGQKVLKSQLGAWIAYAPGALVGKYAVGDVDRTFALFDHLHDRTVRLGMQEAYDRERKLLPILMENERVGLRIDMGLLEQDVARYQAALESVEAQMRAYLNASGLSFDNDRDVAAVFEERGVIHPDRWVRTPKSNQLSVSKENLTPDAFVDPLFASAFGYRNRLVTCLKMFMLPWLEQAGANNGYIHTSWNQVRGERGGARTGRPSMMKPNLLNVSKSFEDRGDGYVHPNGLPEPVPPLPLTRRYILPDEDAVFLHRDFDGQELRVFAHFESGPLMQAYLDDAALDPHDWVRREIRELVGRDLDRGSVKIMNFQSLYGGGVTAIAKGLRCTRREAQEFKTFHDQALPGRKILSEEILRFVRRGEPIRTWGGRLYHVEPPSFSKKFGRTMTWEYKLINYLIQGSAADLTKEAIVDWYYGGGSSAARFLVTVYDEINISAPNAVADEAMQYLRECMERPRLDVPMRSSGKRGPSWGSLSACD